MFSERANDGVERSREQSFRRGQPERAGENVSDRILTHRGEPLRAVFHLSAKINHLSFKARIRTTGAVPQVWQVGQGVPRPPFGAPGRSWGLLDQPQRMNRGDRQPLNPVVET